MGKSLIATLWINFLRASCAGLIISIVMVITGAQISNRPAWLHIIMGPLFWPFVNVIYYPFWFVLKSIGVSMAAWPLIVFSFIWGDPLMYVLHKFFPRLVPVEKYKLIWFTPYITVYKNELSLIKAKIQAEKEEREAELQEIKSYSSYSASEWNSFSRSVINKDLSYLPGGDLGSLGKAIINNDISTLPSGELGQLGRGIINKNISELPSGELGSFGRGIIKNDIKDLPNGGLHSIGKAIVNKDSKEL